MAAVLNQYDTNYAAVARAIDYIRQHAMQQPPLDDIAAYVGMSPFHFQRMFAQWAGVSPKRFLQYLTKERARQVLLQTGDLLTASFELGLSTPSRLHDLLVSCEAMSPGELRHRGAGVDIEYGTAFTPFGLALIASTARGVCHFEFCDVGDLRPDMALQSLQLHWPLATLVENNAAAEQLAAQIFPVTPTAGKLHLVLRGTNFQIKVWEALLRIPPGRMMSYGQLATMAGVPRASRAVGTAMAANTIGYLIPCHRVIRADGDFGHYRWHPTRKAALLGWEAARHTPAEIA